MGRATGCGRVRLAFTLAAPFVLVSVLYNLTLGVINRAMPQLMVVFVGAPVITGLGLAVLFADGPGAAGASGPRHSRPFWPALRK